MHTSRIGPVDAKLKKTSVNNDVNEIPSQWFQRLGVGPLDVGMNKIFVGITLHNFPCIGQVVLPYAICLRYYFNISGYFTSSSRFYICD